ASAGRGRRAWSWLRGRSLRMNARRRRGGPGFPGRGVREGEAPPGFEPGGADLQSSPLLPQLVVNADASENASGVLASCLALLARKSPDLAMLAERWDTLPEAVRAGIVAMVKAAAPPE